MNPDDIYISLANNTLTQGQPMTDKICFTPDQRPPAERVLDPKYRATLRKVAAPDLSNVEPVLLPPTEQISADILSLLDLVESLEKQFATVQTELHRLANEVLGDE